MLTAGPSDENCRFRRSKLAAVDAAETAENSCFPLAAPQFAADDDGRG